MVAGGEHCQLRAAIEVLVPYSSPISPLLVCSLKRTQTTALFTYRPVLISLGWR
jgi:hypothetical protein